MKSRIIETHFIDKHEGGVHSSEFKGSGSVQNSLGSDFPDPDERFFPEVKSKKKRKGI